MVTHPPLAADAAGTVRPRLRAHDPPRRQGPAALLLTAIVSATAFASTAGSTAAMLALLGAAGFLATLIGSAAALATMQRQILTASPHPV